jgi:hypothetical protein
MNFVAVRESAAGDESENKSQHEYAALHGIS